MCVKLTHHSDNEYGLIKVAKEKNTWKISQKTINFRVNGIAE